MVVYIFSIFGMCVVWCERKGSGRCGWMEAAYVAPPQMYIILRVGRRLELEGLKSLNSSCLASST